MLKNNIKTFGIFAFVKFISYYAFVAIGHDTSHEWRVERYNEFIAFEQNKGLIVVIVSIIICGIIARFVLDDQKSIIKNMLSVSALFVILLFCNLTDHIYYLNFNYVLTGAYAQLWHFKYGKLLEFSIIFLPSLIMGLCIRPKKIKLNFWAKFKRLL